MKDFVARVGKAYEKNTESSEESEAMAKKVRLFHTSHQLKITALKYIFQLRFIIMNTDDGLILMNPESDFCIIQP